MHNFFRVANFTLKEVFKSRLFLTTLFVGILIVFFSWVLSEVSYGETKNVGLDIGLGFVFISSVGTAFALGFNLLRTEIESRTLYLTLARPVDRWVYFSGRLFGVSLFLFINVAILSGLISVLFLILGGVLTKMLFWSAFFIYLEANIVMAMVVFFSLISNQVISFLSAGTILFAGHFVEGVKGFSIVKSDPTLNLFIDLYSKIFPNFSTLNLKEFVIYGEAQYQDSILHSGIYGLSYFLIFSLFGIFMFNLKELE